ncbi:MAG: cholesterol oxidase, partial [Gordonia sp. (in: high G+C Gram-positive bacteria)]
KGEADPRPAQGAPYQRINAVAPANPVVPADAPGALRLSITPIASVAKARTAASETAAREGTSVD